MDAKEPQRNLSSKTDDKIKTIEQTGYDIKYQEELLRHLDRRNDLKEGLSNAYSILYANFCAKVMKS